LPLEVHLSYTCLEFGRHECSCLRFEMDMTKCLAVPPYTVWFAESPASLRAVPPEPVPIAGYVS